MPTYEYKCTDCGARTQRAFRIGEQPAVVDCRSCYQSAKRIYSPVGVTFKGSGFYRTDQ